MTRRQASTSAHRLKSMTRAQRIANLVAVVAALRRASSPRSCCSGTAPSAGPTSRSSSCMYVAHRLRHHDRLPPPVHAPRLRDLDAACAYALASLGSMAVAGPGHQLGRRPPQAPRVHRRGGRPAQPARRPRRRLPRRASRASGTRTSAGCSADAGPRRPRALRAGPARRPGHALRSTARSSLGRALGAAAPVRARLRAHRHASPAR